MQSSFTATAGMVAVVVAIASLTAPALTQSSSDGACVPYGSPGQISREQWNQIIHLPLDATLSDVDLILPIHSADCRLPTTTWGGVRVERFAWRMAWDPDHRIVLGFDVQTERFVNYDFRFSRQ